MAPRIKSPLLYQLSYRPNFTDIFGKRDAKTLSCAAIVPPVYPNRAPGST